MTQVRKFWPILTGTYRYEKTVSTRNRGHGVFIDAPIMAYLIETANGRILYDVGCDHRKLDDPAACAAHYAKFDFGPPAMPASHRLPARLAALGLAPADVDMVFIGHLHFDHAGGLHEFAHAEVHVHERELVAAHEPADRAYFADDFAGDYRWRPQAAGYELVPGVQAVESFGHTAGHMSMLVELPKGQPILICGDAADLTENLEDEIAPGLCYRDDETDALASIRRLKALAAQTGAKLWPNHDLAFFNAHDCFPAWAE